MESFGIYSFFILLALQRVVVGVGGWFDDDDVYLDKLQTKGVKKSILYM